MYKLILFFLIVMPTALFAQSIEKNIAWTVHDSTGIINLPSQLEQRLNASGSEKKVKKHLESYFVSRGYFDASIDLLESAKVFVSRGERYKLRGVDIKVIGNMDVNYNLKPGDYFESSVIQKENFRLLRRLEDMGYPVAEVRISRIIPDGQSHTVDLFVEIETGEQWKSDALIITPTEKVGEEYVMMASGYRDSMIITPQNLQVIQRNLSNTGYFEEVGNPELLLREGKKTIFVPLKERNPNYFDGIVGFVPTPNNDSQIVGEAELGLANAFTDGSMIDIAFQRLNTEESRLNLGYSQNFLAGLPLDISGSFMFFQQDTNYQQRQFEFSSSYRATSSLSLTGSVRINTVTANDDIPGFAELDGNSRSGFLGFEYNTLDRPLVPTSGIEFALAFGIGTKRVSTEDSGLGVGEERIRQRILTSSFSWFYPLSSNQVLVLDGTSFFLDAQNFTLSDLVRFGGANSFRGYEEEQFQASRMGWGNVEYRYLVNRNSYLFAFGTAGGFHRPELLTDVNQQLKDSEFLYSSGFGISYRTPIGQISFSYAISPQQDLGNGKIHFGIVASI